MITLADVIRERRLAPYRAENKFTWEGKEVWLTRHMFKMLNLLRENEGYAVRYQALYDCVRGEDFNASDPANNVRVMMKRMRTKFAEAGIAASIVTHNGAGYRWAPDPPAPPALDPFVKRMQDALDTGEEGDALVDVARNAHAAERENAARLSEERSTWREGDLEMLPRTNVPSAKYEELRKRMEEK